MFYIDLLSDSALSIESSLWSGGANFALHQLGYLIDLCQPVSEARGTRFHRSAEGFWWSLLPCAFPSPSFPLHPSVLALFHPSLLCSGGAWWVQEGCGRTERTFEGRHFGFLGILSTP